MAKPLQTDPPSSSVARLLDPSAAARATIRIPLDHGSVASPEISPHPGLKVTTSALIKREFILTPEANATLDRLIDIYRRGTRTRLAASHILRTLLLVTQDALDALAAELTDLPPMKLPSNARGREADREHFEQSLAEALRTALQRRFFALSHRQG
jgi:hypothetical protein